MRITEAGLQIINVMMVMLIMILIIVMMFMMILTMVMMVMILMIMMRTMMIVIMRLIFTCSLRRIRLLSFAEASLARSSATFIMIKVIMTAIQVIINMSWSR